MEVVLAGVGLGVGLLGALLSLLIPVLVGHPGSAAGRAPRCPPAIVVALAAVVGLFLISLRAAPPFSPGQRLGWGLLMGGLAGVVAGLGCARLRRPAQVGYYPYPSGLALSMALAAVSLALLCFPGDPADALLGAGLGFLGVAMVFHAMQVTEAEVALALEAGGALAATLAAGCAVAVHQFDSRAGRGWWACLLALAALWLLGRLLAYIGAEQPSAARYPALLAVFAALAASTLTLVLGGLLGVRVEPPEQLYALLAVGIVTGGLVAWLAASAGAEGPAPGRLGIPALGVLLVVFLAVVTFKLLGGLGVAVALVAAWAVAGAVLGLPGGASRTPVLALMLGVAFLLVRLLLARTHSGLEHVGITPHYALVGIVLGVTLPFAACSFRLNQGVGRAILVALVVLLSPPLLLMLWGPPAALGLVLGLVGAQALSVLLLPVCRTTPEAAVWHAPVSLMAIAMSLLTVQVMPALASLYQVSRATKAYVAAAVALVAVLAVIGVGLAQLRHRSGVSQGEEG